jgi:hypothetical protein
VNTDVDKHVIMVLKGELVAMLLQIAPGIYSQYLTSNRKVVEILYVKLNKALYGLMRACLLFYRKLWTGLKAYGFKVNVLSISVAWDGIFNVVIPI